MTEIENTTQAEPINIFSTAKLEPTVIPIENKNIVIDEGIKEPVVETVVVLDDNKPEVLPPLVESIKFANEESEKVHNLLIDGRIDEVLDILNEQKKLSAVNKLPASDIIKLHLQYTNKDYTESEINDLFEEKYALPLKPEKDYSETDEEFELRESKYNKEVEKLENKIKRDAKPATSELLKLHKEIVLPNTQKADVPVNQELTQEELEANKMQAETFLKSVEDGLSKFNGYESTFKDEEVEIPVAYRLTKEEKAEIQPLIALSNSDAGAFLQKIGWLDSNGNIDAIKLAQDLPLILNKEKVLSKMVSETGNKMRVASIKSIKNIDYSGAVKSGGDVGQTPQQLESKMVHHFFSSM